MNTPRGRPYVRGDVVAAGPSLRGPPSNPVSLYRDVRVQGRFCILADRTHWPTETKRLPDLPLEAR
jgi:hypothetical protein